MFHVKQSGAALVNPYIRGWFERNAPSSEQSSAILSEYGRLLLRETGVRNLTGASSEEELVKKHILPSLELARGIKGVRGVDVGSGNGLPGLVIAVFSPEKYVTLMEPVKYRADFLRKAARLGGIENVMIIGARAENAGRDPFMRESFDFATARAVAPLSISSELVLPLLATGGRFYAQPGSDVDGKIRSASNIIKDMGGVIESSGEGMVIVRKDSRTPSRFPRSWKRIKKNAAKTGPVSDIEK